jgi:hypothetical protein
MKQEKEKKSWKTVLVDRVDKSEWAFPTMAVGNHSGIVVEMTGKEPETGEGVGRVLIADGDRHEGMIKKTWQLHNFTPVDGRIERVRVEPKKSQATA